MLTYNNTGRATPADVSSCAPTAVPGRATRLVAALLPKHWPGRTGALQAADRLDRAHGPAASTELLQAFTRWRGTGELPTSAVLRDLLFCISEALGSIGPELKLRQIRPGRSA
ncbi:MAG: hypothetical protein JNL08_05790 [Planctomycetes bacterium]|nr:hypothetical protein [Planctomycetota bacterium]